MKSTEQHWLNEYLPELPNYKIADIRNNQQFKTDTIAMLAQALGAEFHQYVDKPNDYSAKDVNKWQFFPSGSDKAILFLPEYVCDTIGEARERQICELFNIRIKYVSNPVQL